MLGRLASRSRRAVGAAGFLLPVVAGVALAMTGALLQGLITDRTKPVPGGTQPVVPQAPGAARASEPPPVDLLGVIVASEVVEIAARSEGRVVAIAAQLGDPVALGAVLATIDDRDQRDQLAAARAALLALGADRDKASSELDEARDRKQRSERVSHVLSEEELARVGFEAKHAGSRLAATRARLDEQQTRIAILERTIAEAQVRAPFAGRIAARYVSPGATVAAGTPLLRLVSAGAMRVRFAIPEALAARVRVGMPVAVAVDDEALAGAVDKLAPEVDAASRMIIAEARVEAPARRADHALVGRAARVRVIDPGGTGDTGRTERP